MGIDMLGILTDLDGYDGTICFFNGMILWDYTILVI